ncbi:hypothetical protein ACQP3D_27030, partial [Escherichia coli]
QVGHYPRDPSRFSFNSHSSLHRNLTGTFPEYPDEEEGGSAIIFSNKTPEQVKECLGSKKWLNHHHISLDLSVDGFTVCYASIIFLELLQ